MKDILDYVNEGMKLLALGMSVPVGLLLSSYILNQPAFQKKIRSKEELEIVLQEEADKLGLDRSKIDIRYNTDSFGSRKVDERYRLDLRDNSLLKDGDWFATRRLIKHELWHIKKDCDKGDPKLLNYYLIAEPRAMIYEAWGLKL
jgi:hypothetical protein